MAFELEMYVDILKVLEKKGPLKLSHIMHEVNVKWSVLKGYLGFLIKQGLIEERVVGKSSVYANTPLGTAVIKFFTEKEKALPVKEDSQILPVPIETNVQIEK